MTKKALCFLLALGLALLTACSGQGGDVAPTPEPTPEPTPVALKSASEFQYDTVNNSTLGVSFRCPSHWALQLARRTLCYEEPTNADATPARIAISALAVSKKPSSEAMKGQMERFLTELKTGYASFEALEYKDGVKMLDVSGVRQTYKASADGEDVYGYVLMAYLPATKKIYLYHFSAPKTRYDALETVRDEIRISIAKA